MLAVLCLGADSAFAQSGRPYRGLFSTASSTPDHAVDLAFSVAEAYDDNLLAETGGSVDARRPQPLAAFSPW